MRIYRPKSTFASVVTKTSLEESTWFGVFESHLKSGMQWTDAACNPRTSSVLDTWVKMSLSFDDDLPCISRLVDPAAQDLLHAWDTAIGAVRRSFSVASCFVWMDSECICRRRRSDAINVDSQQHKSIMQDHEFDLVFIHCSAVN